MQTAIAQRLQTTSRQSPSATVHLRPVWSRSGPGATDPVPVWIDYISVQSSVLHVTLIRSSVQAGQVRSWTNEQP